MLSPCKLRFRDLEMMRSDENALTLRGTIVPWCTAVPFSGVLVLFDAQLIQAVFPHDPGCEAERPICVQWGTAENLKDYIAMDFWYGDVFLAGMDPILSP